jgi:hypothetical protein
MIKWIITLIDKTIYSSDTYTWSTIPKLPILKIQLCLPNKKIINLEGFEQYLIISTMYQFFNVKKENMLDTMNILGKKNDEVYQISFHRKGKVFQCKNKWPEWKQLNINPLSALNKKKRFQIKYSKPLPTTISDWRVGVKAQSTKIYITNS